jgi:hypothetical protein
MTQASVLRPPKRAIRIIRGRLAVLTALSEKLHLIFRFDTRPIPGR